MSKILVAYFSRAGQNFVNHEIVELERGKGVAGILMEACVETLEREGLLARTSCSYARHWFEKHPEKAHLLDK